MQFCPKCGAMCVSTKEKGKTILICRKCGHKIKKGYKPARVKGSVKHSPMDDVVVIGEEKEGALPRTKATCRKCGNTEAFWWLQQMRSGDEPPTTFFKCTKCGHCWREY